MHRSSSEARALTGSGVRRYRCQGNGCGWRGLLARVALPRPPGGAAHRRQLWAGAGAVLAALALVGAVIVRQALKPVIEAPPSSHGPTQPVEPARPL